MIATDVCLPPAAATPACGRELRVQLVQSTSELAQLAPEIGQLELVTPMLSPQWLISWWMNCSPRNSEASSLFVLLVWNDTGKLVGFAPWYRSWEILSGNTVRFLGNGKICSDHMDVVCQRGWEDRALNAIANWLHDNSDQWDCLHFEDVDCDSHVATSLTNRLAGDQTIIDRCEAVGSWHIDLPGDWQTYLKSLNKNHRKRCRRWLNHLRREEIEVHCVQNPKQLDRAFPILQSLHNRRRRHIGEPGAFESPEFRNFHRQVLPGLVQSNRAQIVWLEINGVPAAAEYLLIDGNTVYAYQTGICPDHLHYSPGHLSTVVALNLAIGLGCRRFDFLRGGERYKSSWGAVRRPAEHIRIRPNNRISRVRHYLMLVGRGAKRWIRSARPQADNGAGQQ